MASNSVEGLKGSWDYVDGDNFNEYLKAIGVGWTARMTVKGLKPGFIISEYNGKWTVQAGSTSASRESSYIFTPGIEFNETTFDGREVKSIIKFKGNKWIHTSTDNNGKKSVITRYVDDRGQQMIEMESGSVKARRWFKRVE